MSVFLISAMALCLTATGFMEYISIRIDYYKQNSIIDNYLEEIVEKSY